MSQNQSTLSSKANEKHVGKNELILFIFAVFFYTMMTGMINGYRSDYLVNILSLPENYVATFNAVTGIAGYVLSFIYALILDNKKIKNNEKFKPLGLISAIPCGIVTVLIFLVPDFLRENPVVTLIYMIFLALVQGACFYFGNTVNMVAMVMTPNLKERENVLSYRGISSAIGNSAPMVVVLVIGAIIKAVQGKENPELNYILSSILCGLVGTITMLLAMRVIKERTVYSEKKQNPLMGFRDILKSPHARIIILSETLKSLRGIATYMETFMAIAVLGTASKKIIFVLPVGVGTFVGMIVVKTLLKKFNSKQLYIASGIYSVIINCVSFTVGYTQFTMENNGQDPGILQYVFVVCLFLTGLQFGASNLLPTMFQADALDDLELKTGKRLDASLPFAIGLGTVITGTLASTLAPLILYGENSIIQYVQGTQANPYPVQSYDTKIKLLLFYTIFHGIMMLLAGLPFLLYKLTGTAKEEMHAELLRYRETLKAEQEGNTAEKNAENKNNNTSLEE